MYNPDEAYKRLEENEKILTAFYEKGLNEAETRFQIIDTLFVEILGWGKSDLELEHPIGETTEDLEHKTIYADYLLKSDSQLFLIEAKRSGSYFEVPASKHRTYKLDGVITSNTNNKKYIEQSVNYMNKIGTPFVVLCNGLQLFVIRKKGMNKNKDILVFKNLEDIKINFMDFYSTLSPYGRGVERLDEVLHRDRELRQPPAYSKRVFDSLPDKMSLNSTNHVRAITEEYISMYFSDLISDQNKINRLKDCYVDPNGKFATFSQQLKQKVIPKAISDISKITITDVLKTTGVGNFETRYKTYLEEEDQSAVFVLVGEVGSGKSTFINHFYYHQLDDQVRKNLIWIDIDFLHFADEKELINDYIQGKLLETIKSNSLKKFELGSWENKLEIYKEEVDSLLDGLPPIMAKNEEQREQLIYAKIAELEKDANTNMKMIYKYLREVKNQKICFVFDNTDQLNNKMQIEVLMNAFKWSKDLQATAITSLRLENYFEIKDRPPFDAYQSIVFRIEPPSVKELLSKRLAVSKEYPKEHFQIELPGRYSTNRTLKIPIAKFVNVLENTLDSPSEYLTQEMLECLSGGNMRRILSIFKSLIQSGNFVLYENYSIIKKLQHASLSYEEVLNSIALGDNKYYQSAASFINNLFDYDTNDGFNSHFTKIYLLKYLESKTQWQSGINNGYVRIENIYEKFSFLFSDINDLRDNLNNLLEHFFINSDIGERSKIKGTQAVAISELGSYYLNNFITDWRYLKFAMMDTSLKNHNDFEELSKQVKKTLKIKNKNKRIEETLNCIELFLSYLEKSENDDVKYLKDTLKVDIERELKLCMGDIIKGFNHSKNEELKNLNYVLQ